MDKDDKNKNGLDGQNGGDNGDHGDNGGNGKTYDEAYVSAIRKEAATYRTKLRETERSLSEMKAKLDGFDMDEYQRLLKDRDDNEKNKLEKQGEWDKLRERLVADHAKELGILNDTLAQKDTLYKSLEIELNNTVLTNAVALEAAKAKAINPMLVQMAIASEAKVEVTEAGQRVIRLYEPTGEMRLDAKTGQPMTVSKRIAEMKASPEFAHLFEGARPGSGSGSHIGPNGKPDFSKMTPMEKLAWERKQMFAQMQG